MKRVGFIYDKMSDWNLIKEAERVSLANKKHNHGYKLHEKSWLKNLVEIQEHIINHTMKTSDYHYDECISGQGKKRKIAKLHFHPSHIFHQLLVMAIDGVIDKSYIRHTYASRKGYGQHKGALQLNKWVQKHHEEYKWYLQFDIVKYYENIPHELLQKELERKVKDVTFINAILEPIRKFAPDGVGIPLGIRPSQLFGNLALSSLDRYIKEELHCKYYLRYLDDFVLLCRTKAEARRKSKKISDFIRNLGFDIHQPRLDKVSNGIDMLGYITRPKAGMFWRNSNKRKWLKARSHVTNKNRLRELDSSAWGNLVHGNKHCKKLYNIMGGIPFSVLNIDTEQRDQEGRRIIDLRTVSMEACLGQEVVIVDIVPNIKTVHGEGRIALEIIWNGVHRKLITNAPFKKQIIKAWEMGVTRMHVTFVEEGTRHYKMTNVSFDEVRNRPVTYDNENSCVIFSDTNERVNF